MTEAPPPGLFDVAPNTPTVPVAELQATTVSEEARVAMALVAGLRARDVPIRDVVIVARNLDQYERVLTRAAVRYGIIPTFWTQINLGSTRVYQLVVAVCELFAATAPSGETLVRPLELGWTPADADAGWPLSTETLALTAHETRGETRAIDAWQSRVADASWSTQKLTEFVAWAADAPDPTPAVVRDSLADIVESYRESVLPTQRAADAPPLLETETAAQAVVHMEALVEQVAKKYADRLAAGRADASWRTVAGLCESIATQRPGRREHGNALAIDILESNDVLWRRTPFVIALGLVDDMWPQRPSSMMPPEARHAILAGEDSTETLAPRTAWRGGRDWDQFRETVQAATAGLIVTTHEYDADGVRRARSALLDYLDTDVVSSSERRSLLSTDRSLPAAVRAMVCDAVTGSASEPTSPEGVSDE